MKRGALNVTRVSDKLNTGTTSGSLTRLRREFLESSTAVSRIMGVQWQPRTVSLGPTPFTPHEGIGVGAATGAAEDGVGDSADVEVGIAAVDETLADAVAVLDADAPGDSVDVTDIVDDGNAVMVPDKVGVIELVAVPDAGAPGGCVAVASRRRKRGSARLERTGGASACGAGACVPLAARSSACCPARKPLT